MYIIKAISLNTGVEWCLRYWIASTGTTHFESENPYLFHSLNEARYVLGITIGKRPNARGWEFIVLKAEDKHDNDKFIYRIQCH